LGPDFAQDSKGCKTWFGEIIPVAIRRMMMTAMAIPIFRALRMITPTIKPRMRGTIAATRKVVDRSGSAMVTTGVLRS